MPVDLQLSRQMIVEELQAAQAAASAFGWIIKFAQDELSFTVELKSSVDNEVYILELNCTDYKELPPHIEFILPTGEHRVPSAYPESTDSFFHSNLLICYPFNRGAYGTYSGPHQDWQMSGWQALCPEASTLGDILLSIQHRLNSPALYKGRRK